VVTPWLYPERIPKVAGKHGKSVFDVTTVELVIQFVYRSGQFVVTVLRDRSITLRRTGMARPTKRSIIASCTDQARAQAAAKSLTGFPRNTTVTCIDGVWSVVISLASAKRIAAQLSMSNAETSQSSRGMTWRQMRARIANLEKILENYGLDAGKSAPIEVARGTWHGKRAPGSFGSSSR
jgi:hypothetical protein